MAAIVPIYNDDSVSVIAYDGTRLKFVPSESRNGNSTRDSIQRSDESQAERDNFSWNTPQPSYETNVDVKLDWIVNGRWESTTTEVKAKTGISRYRIERSDHGMTLWDYRLWIDTDWKDATYYFRCAAGDQYMMGSARSVKDYNSDKPEIVSVTLY